MNHMCHLFSSLFVRKKTQPVRYPTSCSIVVTNRCFLKCKMCHMWKTEIPPNEITSDECIQFIQEAKDIVRGDKELIISGGEPLLKEGIYDIIRSGVEAGFKVIMPTNGYLINEEVARKLDAAGLNEIFISLDSNKAETHDFLRGKEGCFDTVMAGIEALHTYCAKLRINHLSVLSEVNKESIIPLLETVEADNRRSGIYFQVIAKPFFTNAADEWWDEEEFSFLWPKNHEEINAVIDEIIRLKTEKNYTVHNNVKQLELFKRYFMSPRECARKSGCYLGDHVLNVDSTGNINLCCFDKPQGNIREDNIRTLWATEEIACTQEKMRTCRRNCHNTINCFFKENE